MIFSKESELLTHLLSEKLSDEQLTKLKDLLSRPGTSGESPFQAPQERSAPGTGREGFCDQQHDQQRIQHILQALLARAYKQCSAENKSENGEPLPLVLLPPEALARHLTGLLIKDREPQDCAALIRLLIMLLSETEKAPYLKRLETITPEHYRLLCNAREGEMPTCYECFEKRELEKLLTALLQEFVRETRMLPLCYSVLEILKQERDTAFPRYSKNMGLNHYLKWEDIAQRLRGRLSAKHAKNPPFMPSEGLGEAASNPYGFWGTLIKMCIDREWVDLREVPGDEISKYYFKITEKGIQRLQALQQPLQTESEAA